MKKQLCGMAIVLAGVPVAHAEPYFMLGYGQAENAGDRMNKQFKGDFTKATSITAGAGYEYDSRISAELEYSYTQEFDNKANTTDAVKSQALAGVVCGRGRNPTLRLWPTIFSGKIDVFPGDRRSRLISSMTSVAPA